jgi:hypothetical protein
VAQGTKTDAKGCAPGSDPGSIQKTTDRVAFDRKTGLAVNGAQYKAAVDGNTAIAHQGLDYTFPIGTEKKSYLLFDTTAGKAFPAAYQGEDTIDGLDVYRFKQTVPDTSIKIQGLLPGVYSGSTTVWVEPTTGVIVKGAQQIVQRFASNSATVFDGTLTFNDATVKKQVDFANEQLTKIQLIRNWLPLAGLVLGLGFLAAAAYAGRRRTSPRAGVSPVAEGSSQT